MYLYYKFNAIDWYLFDLPEALYNYTLDSLKVGGGGHGVDGDYASVLPKHGSLFDGVHSTDFSPSSPFLRVNNHVLWAEFDPQFIQDIPNRLSKK